MGRTEFGEVLQLQSVTHRDERGWFREAWSAGRYEQLNVGGPFVQDNLSRSRRNVLRGMHAQHPHGQAKLISLISGSVFDVVVDIRRGSPTFGGWAGYELSAERGQQLYVPAGFAHGFVALADDTTLSYKCTDRYDAASELSILWNDPDIGIDWPVTDPIVSSRDAGALRLRDVAPDRLPRVR